MKKFFTPLLFFYALFFWNFDVYAQLFPVQLTPVFKSPYSVKLSDYATSMDAKMQLFINPTDIAIANRPVRLKLHIQGNGVNIQSADFLQGQKPIYINGGELQTLTNTDISALFRLENLQGITAAKYAAGLPDGMYNFCFEMYDFVTNQKISQKSCASLYLILNDPPFLNTPQKNEQIAETDFPNILFTWTPRQINATNVSYKFELKQLLDPSLNPQFAFQMAPVLYEQTLFGTALLYNLNMPILMPGMRYAWRVKAISTTGLSENAVFKNDGYSEIYSFKYTQKCDPPTFALSEIVSPTSVKITWQGLPDHTKYQVQYRKKSITETNKRGKEKEKTFEWFSTYSQNNQALLTNLEPETTYEFKVGSTCTLESDGIQSYNYSAANTFTIPKKENAIASYNCGIKPMLNIGNRTPINNLLESETFNAGDFPVTILELLGNNPYYGKGYIIVPYLANTKIAVAFSNITINTDYQLINGVVETSYNNDWKNVTDIEDFTGEGQGGQIEEMVKFEIHDIVINANGDIVVNGKNGEQITIPGGKDTVITDSSGKVYAVDSKGNGSNEGAEPAPGGKPTPENTDGVDKNGQATAFTAKGASIVFSAINSKYAFDAMPENAPAAIQKLYKKVGDIALPYKAVLNGDTDTITATLTITDTIVKPENIVFKTQNGAKVDFTRSDKTFVLTVKGNQTYGEEQILAVIQQGGKWKVIGAFMLVHISEKVVNVELVPTDTVSQNKLDEVIKNTKAIYNKVGVKVNFTKQPILDISSVVSGNIIQTEKNTLTSTYSTEQQSINSLYQTTESSYVLFVTEKTSSTGQQGYMRLNGQFGYVFKSGLGKTPAHELGHGIFKLEHPFELYKTPESSTDFLMDYDIGTVLSHVDWKQINDPAFKLYAFQSQSSGENIVPHFIVIKKYLFNGKIKTDRVSTEKMTLKEYGNYKKSLWDGFSLCTKKDQNHEWVKGFEAYTQGNSCDMKNGFYGVVNGILFIDATSEASAYKIYYFNDEDEIQTYPYIYGLKNAVVFVNGYRNNIGTNENPNTNNFIRTTPIDNYWENIDDLFVKLLHSTSIWYADGHHSVETSNHRSRSAFVGNMTFNTMATIPNKSGFDQRKTNGIIAGNNLIKELQSSKFDKKEKIDIVAHSMGYAYALGIVKSLKTKGYLLGRFYIIAPENACSGGDNWSDFEEVWQYGSNLGEPDADTIKEQDGVAPQCPAIGLTNDQRVFIPKDWKPKGFTESHSIGNYKWIFEIKDVKGSLGKGYIKERK